ncbi:hypothetical protein [Ralstonia phage RP13]|nr:hypothetical protein [Ralstonia phage RP13]
MASTIDPTKPTLGTPKTQELRDNFQAAKNDIEAIQNQYLLIWASTQTFTLVSGTRDSNGALLSANLLWPDGATGAFAADVVSTSFPGAVDAWHATHFDGVTTKTITQALVTRDSNGGVIAQPAITIV